ncbi:MAG: hypothetical protein JJU24_07560 [Natronohydrobacter sp.]|nr:hypothetical protein [Natronohydrobacter sp.]
MHRYSIIATIVLLAGCELELAGPPGVQPPPAKPGTAELRSMCTNAAQAQDLGVLRTGEFLTVTGSGGMEIGSTAIMTVVRDSQVFDMRCNYSFGDRQIRLTEV